jgi:hypothetical protein
LIERKKCQKCRDDQDEYAEPEFEMMTIDTSLAPIIEEISLKKEAMPNKRAKLTLM